jgi:hypothetical protein
LGENRADNGQTEAKNQEKQTLHHKRAIISNWRKNCKSLWRSTFGAQRSAFGGAFF